MDRSKLSDTQIGRFFILSSSSALKHPLVKRRLYAFLASLFCCAIFFTPLNAELYYTVTKELNTSLIEDEIHRLVNEERKNRKIAPLQYDKKMAEIALMHSRNMSEKNFISHRDSDGLYPQGRVLKFYPEIIGGVGENIAYMNGDDEKIVAADFVRRWMNSPGHRANILNTDYNITGIGIKQKGEYFYGTQKFIEAIAKVPADAVSEFMYGSESALKFEFAGSFKKEDITVFCDFADGSIRHYLKDGRYYTGMAPLIPKWDDDKSFTLTFKFDKGRGIYKFRFGKNGSTYSDGFNVTVK